MHFDLFRLRIPLARPYHLSFGPVLAYETLLVRCVAADGTGWGEATLLTGYTSETIEASWHLARQLSESLRDRSADDACARLLALQHTYPFTATAFCTAIEMAQRMPLLLPGRDLRVPILGLLHAQAAGEIQAEVEQLLCDGYRTIKVKVGFEPIGDARRVAAIQRAVAGRAQIRLDANQGYSVEQTRQFLSRLDPVGIELFEQPCAAGDWQAHAQATAGSPVPVMLDESIYGEADIDRVAHERAARFVKVKLMKFISVARLAAAIDRIRMHGLIPVLGNGVAGDLSCWMEACVAAGRIDNAGEMNGFLKPVRRCQSDGLRFESGCIHLPAGWAPSPDPAFIDEFQVAQPLLAT